MRGIRALTVLAGAVLLLASGAAMAATTLRIGLAEDPDALDPTLARTFVGRIVFASLCDKLFDIGPHLEIVPQLATAYSWSADNKALTIQLRRNVLFQDGTPMDAAAVKYSIERHLKMPGSNRKGEISAVTGVDVIDDHTVRLDLATPFAPLLAQLTDRAGMILSPKAAAAEGDKFAAHPVCAGPFKFTQRVAQDRIVLDRFPQYWDKDKIHIDRIVFMPIPDASVRLANLQSGGLDMIERVSPADLAQIKGNPGLATASIVELGYQSLAINVGRGAGAHNPLGREAKLREALDLAIDRDALNQVVFEGQFQPGNQWVPPNNPYYDTALPVPKRDIAKAKALVQQVAHGEVTVDLMAPNDSLQMQVAQVLQAMAKEAGINLNIQATEFASSLGIAEKGDFQLYLFAWSGRTDPDGNLYNFIACKGPLNYSGYCNPALDREIDAARATEDPHQRAQLYAKVAQTVLSDRPVIYLYHRRWIYAYSKHLTGFTPYPDGLIRPQGLRLQ
ncbi:MAG TPA: ABC transporter substrate-binding protein [Stellaceae bacterium]|nr:ABC transporter substrate-binding protein [Stellaceae bacterium]